MLTLIALCPLRSLKQSVRFASAGFYWAGAGTVMMPTQEFPAFLLRSCNSTLAAEHVKRGPGPLMEMEGKEWECSGSVSKLVRYLC